MRTDLTAARGSMGDDQDTPGVAGAEGASAGLRARIVVIERNKDVLTI